MGCLQGIFHVLHSVAHGSLQLDLIKFLHEQVTVLGVHNSLDAGAQHLNAILLQNTFLVKLGTAVQGCLSTESQQDAVRTLLLDDLGDKVGGHRLEIDLVSNAFRGLDGGNVRIHQHTLDALFAQGLQCL